LSYSVGCSLSPGNVLPFKVLRCYLVIPYSPSKSHLY